MTDKEKLDEVLSRLKDVAFADEKTDPDEYWMDIDSRCDNATDVICDTDRFIKQLITYIES